MTDINFGQIIKDTKFVFWMKFKLDTPGFNKNFCVNITFMFIICFIRI